MLMCKQLRSWIKPFLKSLLAIGLVLTLALGHSDSALAARGGGRMGGGSFRAPTRTYSPPRSYSAPRSYAPGGGYYAPFPGGGFGFPLVWGPVFFGGGGLFSVLMLIVVASFLMQAFRRASDDGDSGYDPVANQSVTVARVQVGLMANARELQPALNQLALTADTGTQAGLTHVMQETTLALLRHPEYWVYGTATTQNAGLLSAENEFNRLALAERSKFTEETLSNVNNQVKQIPVKQLVSVSHQGGALVDQGPGEYLVVTLLAAIQGKFDLPAVRSEAEMRQVLQRLGGVPSDRLLALEVLWTPQAEDDTLTSDDLLANYPDMKLI